MNVSLRTAARSDMEFMLRVHREAMGPHVERAFGPWDEASQRARFLQTTRPADHRIVLLDGEPAGCLWVREHEDSLELVRIYLLPEAQGQGLGTRLTREVQERARAAGLPLRLRVLKVNPARRLYRRLGFEIAGETESHLQMVWRPE